MKNDVIKEMYLENIQTMFDDLKKLTYAKMTENELLDFVSSFYRCDFENSAVIRYCYNDDDYILCTGDINKMMLLHVTMNIEAVDNVIHYKDIKVENIFKASHKWYAHDVLKAHKMYVNNYDMVLPPVDDFLEAIERSHPKEFFEI